MGNWVEEHIADFAREKYNCAQTMTALSLASRGRKNDELIRYAYGLGAGLHVRHVCGTLTGGCCLLSGYDAPDGLTPEDDRTRRKDMVNAFVKWFEARYGSLICMELLEGDLNRRKAFCPGLMKESYEKCMEILRENGVDIGAGA